MERIIKFPKEKTQLINRVYDAYEEENYQLIFSYKDEILSNFKILTEEKVFDILLEATFNLYLFEDVILLTDELVKLGYESFDLYYYALLAYLALVDIYQAKNLIRRSKLLNEEGIKYYYTHEGANYSNILNLNEGLFFLAAPCLVIVNFINEVASEMAGNIEIDHEYLLYRFFDLVNVLFELGYDDEILEMFEKALKIVFQLEV